MRFRTLLTGVAICAVAVCAVVIGGCAGARPPGGDGPFHRGSISVHGDVYRYAVYVPPGRRADGSWPLVVALHGCNMTAGQMAGASGYDALARRHRFVVLYPDVDASDLASGGCWRGIWDPAAEGRGQGDAGAIAQMTEAAMGRWHIDRRRVYAIGISAGGFEAAILGAEYPDLYAAIGIHSGAAFMGGQPGCLPLNESPAPTRTLARAALDEMGARARVMPVIVIHGRADNRIPYRCGRQAVSQWLHTDDLILARQRRPSLPSTPTEVRHGAVPGGHAYTVASYAQSSGCPVIQFWTVQGMGHFWSGGPPNPSLARYSDPRGPSAAAASWSFFSHWDLTGPIRPCRRGGRG